MSKYDKLKQKNTVQRAAEKPKLDLAVRASEEMAKDACRTAEVYRNAGEILDDIDARFEEATGLGADDVAFLFLAIALQCVRQYVLTNFKERKNDQEAAKEVKGDHEEHSNRREGEWYLPEPVEIISNPVPFDANRQTETTKGALKGAGDMKHRLTLGHDPILGWIFGTMNIATSTLTRWDFKSFHIRTREGKTGYGKTAEFDTLDRPADTGEMVEVAIDRFSNTQNAIGPIVLVVSLCKEWEHLKSDVQTKNSLPVPFVSIISPKLASALSKYGIDMANVLTVAKQIKYAEMINIIIGTLHGMYNCAKYAEKNDLYSWSEMSYVTHEEKVLNMFELSKVKTRKILMWSNIVASVSNVIAVAMMEAIAYFTENAKLAEKGLRYIDVGGYAVTLYRIVSDSQFINQIKSEFLEKEWQNAVLGDEYSFLEEAKKYEP
jgi:hypothetical protein